jgi:hypothetical protein
VDVRLGGGSETTDECWINALLFKFFFLHACAAGP